MAKSNKYTLTGKTNSKGDLIANNMARFNQFLKQWPNHKIYMMVEVIEPEASKLMKAYYYKSILPDFQKAFNDLGERMSLTQVDEKLRELSSVLHEEEVVDGFGITVRCLLTVEQVGNVRLSAYIEDLITIGARDFSIAISSPSHI